MNREGNYGSARLREGHDFSRFSAEAPQGLKPVGQAWKVRSTRDCSRHGREGLRISSASNN
jgi:hypothetical protein